MPIRLHPTLNLRAHLVDGIEQPMLVAPNIRVPLLCVNPAFQEFEHGRDNPPACAEALLDAQYMCQINIAHAQHVRFANARQCRGLDHASETARHVEVPACHGCTIRHVGNAIPSARPNTCLCVAQHLLNARANTSDTTRTVRRRGVVAACCTTLNVYTVCDTVCCAGVRQVSRAEITQ
jgi:hypothetical protein